MWYKFTFPFCRKRYSKSLGNLCKAKRPLFSQLALISFLNRKFLLSTKTFMLLSDGMEKIIHSFK